MHLMLRNALAALLIVCGAARAASASVQSPAHGELFTRLDGDTVRAAIRIELEGRWHIYHDELGHPKAVGQPTTITFQGADVAWGPVRFPEPVRLDQSDVAGPGVFILAHEQELVVYAAGKLAPGASLDGLEAKLKGLVCDDVMGCVPYRQTLTSSGAGEDALFAAFPADLLPARTGSQATPEPVPAATSGAEVREPSAGESQPASAPLAATEPLPVPEEQGLWLFLSLAVVGGLFALVMPCTYPMIPITISFFTKQADRRGGNALSLSLAYGAGIVVIFVLVGVLFGSLIRPFSAHPVTNLVLGLAFVYFALVLFGALNLEPPRFLMNAAGSASTRGGYLGVFLMGATLVVTSFTCTAPFVGSLLSVGASGGNAGRVALGMAVFGLTMAVPFVLLSLLPARMKAMPRSGEWMNTVKVTLGFIELAAALKFISNTDLVWHWGWLSRELFLALWTGIFGVAALYLFGLIHLKAAAAPISSGRMVTGLAFALFALYCWTGAGGSSMDPAMTAIIPNYTNRVVSAGEGAARGHAIVVDDYELARQQARAENKLLLVDFTGYTCVNCRLNEEKVFPADPVRELLGEHFVEARLHTDGDRGEELIEFQRKLANSIATPLYLVLDPETERRIGGPIGGVQSVQGFRGFLADAMARGAAR